MTFPLETFTLKKPHFVYKVKILGKNYSGLIGWILLSVLSCFSSQWHHIDAHEQIDTHITGNSTVSSKFVRLTTKKTSRLCIAGPFVCENPSGRLFHSQRAQKCRKCFMSSWFPRFWWPCKQQDQHEIIIDSFTVSLHRPKLIHSLLAQPWWQASACHQGFTRRLRKSLGTVSGLWKNVKTPTAHPSQQCIAT